MRLLIWIIERPFCWQFSLESHSKKSYMHSAGKTRELFYGLLCLKHLQSMWRTQSQNLWEIGLLRQKREELGAFFAPSPGMLMHLISGVHMFSCWVQINLSSVCTALLRILTLLSSNHTWALGLLLSCLMDKEFQENRRNNMTEILLSWQSLFHALVSRCSDDLGSWEEVLETQVIAEAGWDDALWAWPLCLWILLTYLLFPLYSSLNHSLPCNGFIWYIRQYWF